MADIFKCIFLNENTQFEGILFLRGQATDMPGHGPLARYVKLRVVHAPGMSGTFSPPPLASDPDMHQGTCVTHVP